MHRGERRVEGLPPAMRRRQLGARVLKQYKSYKVHSKIHDRHVMSRIGAGGDKAEKAKKKKNVEFVIVIENELK